MYVNSTRGRGWSSGGVHVPCTRIPDESYRGRLGSLFLCLFDLFREIINSFVRVFHLHQFRFLLLFRCRHFNRPRSLALIRWGTINDRSVPCVINFRFIPRHRRIGMGVAVSVHSHLVRKMLRHCQPISSTEVHEDIHHGRHHHVCVSRADWWNGLHQWPQVCQELPVRPRDEYNQ